MTPNEDEEMATWDAASDELDLDGPREMTDAELNLVMKKLAKLKGYGPMTPEEATAAYDAAEPIPMSKEEIDRIVERVVSESERQDRKLD